MKAEGKPPTQGAQPEDAQADEGRERKARRRGTPYRIEPPATETKREKKTISGGEGGRFRFSRTDAKTHGHHAGNTVRGGRRKSLLFTF